MEDKAAAIREMMKRGELDRAYEEARFRVHESPKNADLGLVLAAVALELDEIDEARGVLNRLLGLEDSGVRLQALLGLSRLEFRLWRFEESIALARRAIDLEPASPEAWSLLAQALELLGDAGGARRADKKAMELDSEDYPLPPRLSPAEIERAIEEALALLPPQFEEIVQEIPVLLERFPTRELAAPESTTDLPLPPDTLGLFTGTARSERSFFNTWEAPGVVFLFQGNLERFCADLPSLTREIAVTLWHELAHFLGFEEEDMPRLGLE